MKVRDKTLWDTINWHVVRPIAWRIAGARDRAAIVKARRDQDIVKS